MPEVNYSPHVIPTPGKVYPSLPLGNAQTILGIGQPEGIVTARLGRFYIDTQTDGLYYKKSGDGTNIGWAFAVT